MGRQIIKKPKPFRQRASCLFKLSNILCIFRLIGPSLCIGGCVCDSRGLAQARCQRQRQRQQHGRYAAARCGSEGCVCDSRGLAPLWRSTKITVIWFIGTKPNAGGNHDEGAMAKKTDDTFSKVLEAVIIIATAIISLEILTKPARRSSERGRPARPCHSRKSGNPVLLGPLSTHRLPETEKSHEGGSIRSQCYCGSCDSVYSVYGRAILVRLIGNIFFNEGCFKEKPPCREIWHGDFSVLSNFKVAHDRIATTT